MRNRTMAHVTNMRRATLGAIGAGALVVTAACGAGNGVRAAGNETGLAPAAQLENANGQVLVNCEPHQRTLVRQVTVNGQPVAQVECVAVEAPAYGVAAAGYPAAVPARDYGYDTRVVQPAPVYRAPAPAPRRVSTQPRVVTERASSGRTWKKSAVIIGSSAGIGAGVGAAMGGKKGALIGAAIGGGSAAIWDQVTRKK